MTGRTRLQPGVEQRIDLLRNYRKENDDEKLPIGHTCGNSMDVPKYSSAEIMKKKLLMAIHLCDAVDGDGSSDDYG